MAMDANKIRLMVIDDQAVVRQGFVSLIKTVPDIYRVLNRTEAMQPAGEPHFLLQASFRRLRDSLAGSRMTAAGVRPETARVIFRRRPLLK